MKLFVDDKRTPIDFDDWVIVRTPKQAMSELDIAVNNDEVIEQVSYDYDMGESTIRSLLMWQAKNKVWPLKASVHSSNGQGRKWLEFVLKNIGGDVEVVAAPEFLGEATVTT